jgi:hypothetical protein
MKTTLNNTFYQLIALYAITILLISLGLFWKYSLQFHIAAIIIAILGISTIKTNKLKINKKLHIILLILAILFLLTIRIIPYLNNQIPLGYDAGIYKYGIENQHEDWVKASLTPGFLYLTNILNQFLTSDTILTIIFILLNLTLALAIYLTTKEYTNKTTAIIAILLYATSLIQFKVFTYLYYKNIIGLTTLLLSFYFYKKKKRIPFIITAALTGAFHRPTFFILALSYLALAIKDYKNIKTHIINGISILILTAIFYIGFFQHSILPLIQPVTESFISPGQSPGTFIDFFTYQYSVLAYLPLAILGLFSLIKNKQLNLIFFYTILTAIIVYFQFFFFNRFIIMLDIGLIITAAIGFSLLIQNKKKLGTIITMLLLISAAYVTINESINSKPLISDQELQAIEYLQNTENNSYVMATTSLYSPYVLGYSGRKTIAPGLFDYNKHEQSEWTIFWTTKDIKEVKSFLNEYKKPLYIFIGKQQPDNIKKFKECFTIYYQENENKIYQYTC